MPGTVPLPGVLYHIPHEKNDGAVARTNDDGFINYC